MGVRVPPFAWPAVSLSERPQFDVTLTEGERCRRTLAVKAPAVVVAQRRNGVARKFASRAKLKGFRSGKASLRVVEQRFGSEIERLAVDELVEQALRETVAARGLRLASEAKVGAVRDEPDGGLSFEISFDVAPTVVVERLGGFRVERPSPPPAGALVDRFLEERRAESATWTPSEGSPEDGDAVTVEISRAEPEEAAAEGAPPRRYDFVLGRGQALPAVEEAVRTLAPGADGEFTVDFPAEHPDEALRGRRNELRIALVERRTPKPPPLDDAFAKAVAGVETLDEWKERLHEQFSEAAQREADAAVHAELVKLVVEANDFDVSDSMVDACAEAMIGDADDLAPEVRGDLLQRIRPEAEFVVRRRLILDHIAETHGLRAGRAEVDAYVGELARKSGTSQAKAKADLRKSGASENIERMLTAKKVHKFLEGQSEITRAA